MRSGVFINVSQASGQYSKDPQYLEYKPGETLTFSLTVASEYQVWPYCSFRIRLSSDTVWTTRLSGNNGGTTLTVPISDLISSTEHSSGIRACRVKCCGMTAENGAEFGWTENEIQIYITEPLAKPKITSVLPKSPKISEGLTITWTSVSNASYYTLIAKHMIGNISTEQIVYDKISSAATDTVTITTPPIQNLTAIEQKGYIQYAIYAYSDDKRFTVSKSDYVSVNLNLASNLRFKLGGEWIRGKPYIKVGGKWHRAVKTYVKVNGKWVNA